MTQTIEKTMVSVKITKSGSGLPCMWESGGGLSSGGSATIITKRDGSKPQSIFIPRSGHLACGEHALVPVHPGYGVVNVRVSHGNLEGGTIGVIHEITDESATVEVVASFRLGEWDSPVPTSVKPALEAAVAKASCRHCRSVYWAEEPRRKEVAK